MYIRPIYRRKNGKEHAYWALMESVRTARGPRSRVVAYLGALSEKEQRAFTAALGEGTTSRQGDLFETGPSWVEVDTSQVRVERLRAFGGPWLGSELLRKLGLDTLFSELMPPGREDIPWASMAAPLVL